MGTRMPLRAWQKTFTSYRTTSRFQYFDHISGLVHASVIVVAGTAAVGGPQSEFGHARSHEVLDTGPVGCVQKHEPAAGTAETPG